MNEAAAATEPAVLNELAQDVEAELARRLDEASLPENLLDALRYALLGGGKRLRPALTLLSCEAVGGRRDAAMPAACALEMIHTFSLVHDDLPAMDDDAIRRGRPTLHVHAGEAMAILAGDALMSLAFEVVVQGQPGDGGSGEAALLTAEMARGATGMIAGQVYDTLGGFPKSLTDEQRLRLVHGSKTGALIRAAARMGAICGGADVERLEALSRYGEAAGLMFQVVDDLLDVTQSAEHIGKAAGKDGAAGKITFPGLLGIERSHAEVQRLRDAALAALGGLGSPAEGLRELCRYMAVRTR